MYSTGRSLLPFWIGSYARTRTGTHAYAYRSSYRHTAPPRLVDLIVLQGNICTVPGRVSIITAHVLVLSRARVRYRYRRDTSYVIEVEIAFSFLSTCLDPILYLSCRAPVLQPHIRNLRTRAFRSISRENATLAIVTDARRACCTRLSQPFQNTTHRQVVGTTLFRSAPWPTSRALVRARVYQQCVPQCAVFAARLHNY